MRSLLLAVITVGWPTPHATAMPTECEGHSAEVCAVAVSPDGMLVASSGDDSMIRLWDATTGSQLRTFTVPVNPRKPQFFTDIAFSPDGKTIAAVASHLPVTFWDVETGEKKELSLAIEDAAYSIAFSPVKLELAVAEKSAVRVWSLADFRLLNSHSLDPGQISNAWRVVYSNKGRYLAAAMRDYGGSPQVREPKIQVWDANNGKLVFSAWKNRSASAVAFSPDESLVAAASGEIVEMWSLKSQDSLMRFSTGSRAVFCLAFSPDGKLIATTGEDGDINLWSVADGQSSGAIRGHTSQVHDFCFSVEGRFLISGGNDKLVRVWNLREDVTR